MEYKVLLYKEIKKEIRTKKSEIKEKDRKIRKLINDLLDDTNEELHYNKTESG